MQTGPTAAPGARFDDLVAGTTLEFDRFAEVVVAHRPEEVLPALRRVQQAVDGGRWAAGHVAYEAALGLDPRFRCHEPTPGRPLVWFGLADDPTASPAALPAGRAARLDWRPQWTEAEHAERIERVHAAIARGDTYQCNLTTRLTAALPADLVADAGERRRWYAHLVRRQQGSFHAHLETGGLAVLSASPELFLRHEDGVRSVVFSREHSMLISGSWDKTLHIHMLADNALSHPYSTLSLPDKPHCLAVSKTNLVVACASHDPRQVPPSVGRHARSLLVSSFRHIYR